MEYINLDAQVGNLSGVLSPARYLEHLPSLADDLPAGARGFATAPEHYDFSSKRCVKDLEVQHIRGVGADEQQMEIQFRHNCWKHDEDLVIRYTGVSSFDGVSIEDNDWATVGTAILDEVCPTSTAAVTRSRSGTAHSPSSAVISSRHGPRLTAPTIHRLTSPPPAQPTHSPRLNVKLKERFIPAGVFGGLLGGWPACAG